MRYLLYNVMQHTERPAFVKTTRKPCDKKIMYLCEKLKKIYINFINLQIYTFAKIRHQY